MHSHSHSHLHRRGLDDIFSDITEPKLPGPEPELLAPSLVPRTPDLTSREEASKTCDPKERTCGPLPTVSNTSLIIGLSVAIPVFFAIVAFFFLHRRHVRKQREEDAKDKHKSLDFGLGESYGYPDGKKRKGRKNGNVPEMTITDTEQALGRGRGRGRGMSMDLVGSPYLLPAAVQGSRDSIHSLSRSMHDNHDPYRPVTFGSNDGPYRSNRVRGDNASTFTGSSAGTESTANLMRNAQGMSHSIPQRGDSMAPQAPQPVHAGGTPRAGLAPPTADAARDSYFDKNAKAIRASNNYLGSFIHSGDPSTADHSTADPSAAPSLDEQFPMPPSAAHMKSEAPLPTFDFDKDKLSDSFQTNSKPLSPPNEFQDHEKEPPRGLEPQAPLPEIPSSPPQVAPSMPPKGLPETSRPPRGQSLNYASKTTSMASSVSDYGDAFKLTAATPPRGSLEGAPDDYRQSQANRSTLPVVEEYANEGLTVQDNGFDPRRLSMGIRPLPELDDVVENPEERANRIRSFYKEYFDENKPIPRNHYYETGPYQAGPHQAGPEYYEDYGAEYYGPDAHHYEPDYRGRPAAPYAQPMGRRAMTPPPRGPPRSFNGGQSRTSGASSVGNRYHQLPPRGMSSLSGRMPPPGRALPPPKALNSLPTPARITEDNLVFTPTDFAPPTSFRDRQMGRRPDSPLGIERPYSPSVRPFTPLASSFDDLSAMPTP
ncbi:hypothetical protein P152DRAFT_106290 [Eremomyces bilateralis CBS 781.70]|uniref:Uncharacterized protein n=1 Tax=Eremomyces bilateralis CBS 781.70 TaxID=1392243 RepID=A0A6G1FWQ2_9PEZI|nr:uncharacterized protein P152DRAFT_106290 [Eremomyces bilateralis CBS 781.70]KAF1810267.1 hypothetical protein P152DRAFT_106290 [Eremomyces bilateralis CBS 781.70]